MSKQSWILGAGSLAAALAMFAAPAQARTDASIYLNFGGPAYVAPQPYVYAQPGHYYQQPSYVYTQPGYVYTQPAPVYARPGHVHYGQHRGYRRDRDGDGVPNRFDRRPNNPYRY